MSKLVILNLGIGNLKEGFPHITAELHIDGQARPNKFLGNLPPNIELAELSRRWQLLYLLSLDHLGFPLRAIKVEQSDNLQYSDVEFSEVSKQLKIEINQWLNQSPPECKQVTRDIRDHLTPNEEIRLIIETNDEQLRLLPWHLWDFFAKYKKAEWSLSRLEYAQVTTQSKTNPGQVKILVILGDDTNLYLQQDQVLWEKFKQNGADPCFLIQPSREQFIEQLRANYWDIIFFAGHSESDGDKGIIHVSSKLRLSIDEFQKAINRSVENGLQIAIFNSCQGLGLAEQLAKLNIPQMIVMRSLIPDAIAHNFLKYFLSEFILNDNKSLYLSLRDTRDKLEEIDDPECPGASWLPVIYQNPTVVPPTFGELLSKDDTMIQAHILPTLQKGRYQVIKQLGQGAFGEIYLAKDTQRNQSHCVIKKLAPKNAHLETATKLFHQEVESLAKLNHLQIPKFLDHFEEHQELYLVEDYIEGDNLQQEIDSGKEFTQQNIIDFLFNVLPILQYLHQNNIIHRDIKPSNLIRDKKTNNFVLIDFGAIKECYTSDANNPTETMSSSVAIYTKGFTPQEQFNENPQANSDLYALGMTAIYLLTGKHPKTLERDHNDNLLNLAITNSDFANIINQMVRSNFRERYQSADDVLKDLTQKLLKKSKQDDVGIKSRQQLPSESKSPPKLKLQILSGLIILVGLGITELSIYPIIRPNFLIWQGTSLLHGGKTQDALDKFNQTNNILSDALIKQEWTVVYKNRGDAYATLGRYTEALNDYNKAIALGLNTPNVWNNKGKVLSKIGKYQESLKAHQEVIDNFKDGKAEAWLGQGLAYIGLHQYSDASQCVQKAIDIKSNTPEILHELATALKYSNPMEAKEVYERTLTLYDDSLRIEKDNQKLKVLWTDKGSVLLQMFGYYVNSQPPQLEKAQQTLEDALSSYNEALKIDSTLYEALLGKANTLSYLGDFLNKPDYYQQALPVYKQATKVNPNDYVGWYNQGDLFLKLEQYPQALDSFKQSIKLKNDFAVAWRGKAFALYNIGNFDEAVKASDKAIEINPNDPFVWYNKGSALEKLGRNQEAIDSYNEAIKIDDNLKTMIQQESNLI